MFHKSMGNARFLTKSEISFHIVQIWKEECSILIGSRNAPRSRFGQGTLPRCKSNNDQMNITHLDLEQGNFLNGLGGNFINDKDAC